MANQKTIDTGISEETKRKILGTIQAIIPGVRVYLFGSRARGTHHDRSDIDIAIDNGEKLKHRDVGEIRDMLNASNIPYKIDVLDIHRIPESFRNVILQEGILWKI